MPARTHGNDGALLSGGATTWVKRISQAGVVEAEQKGYARTPGESGGGAFSPTDIPGLALWLDASDAATITHSSGAVSQLDDKSGNGRHASQATAAEQPSTGTKTLNGKNVIAHDGSDTLLALLPLFPAETPITFFMAWRHVSAAFMLAPSGNGFMGAGQSGSTFGSESVAAGATVTYYKDGVVQALSTRDDVYVAFAGGTHIATITNDVGYGGDAELGAMANFSSSSFRPEADLAEVLMYDTVLSTADREAAEQYLADRWGVTLA